MQAEAVATAQALRELRELFESTDAPLLATARERAARCADAARALRARHREVAVRRVEACCKSDVVRAYVCEQILRACKYACLHCCRMCARVHRHVK